MTKLAFWNGGSPVHAKVSGSGNRQRLTLPDGSVRTGNIAADPAIDLFAYEETGPAPGLYQRPGPVTLGNDGWTITATRSVADIALGSAKEQHKRKATAKFKAVRDGGTVFTVGADDIVLATTHDARLEVAALKERLTGAGTQRGVTRGGKPLVFNQATASDAQDAIDAHHAAASDREYTLYLAIDAAADVDAVRAIDITTGWPSNPEETI